ncbi:C40 family peptidase [Ruficoccus amylovorans]|uniref:C40 family peptidase n=1 Tax=Ruficoccus amylovorans TaxID=1804625 RepID=A0A842H847_9BACT|nr:C40 family peptidase [Ruficoccus amylovorans]MBC2592703.1 C40 family peptidase [Ruficoccus amylovorans]
MTAQPYFSSAERIGKLMTIAASWLDTPYVQSGAVKGCGVSCHRLAAAVLSEAGVAMDDVPERGDTGRRQFAQAMRGWLESRPARFAPVGPDEPLCPGDILLCDFGIGHIALYLGGEQRAVLQVLLRGATHLASLLDPQLQGRVRAAWRPLEGGCDGQ